MQAKFWEFFKRRTSIDVLINTLGNYLNVLFTAVFALILVRILSPSQYGVLSVLLGIAYVLANVLDFGTTATIYSYLPPLLEKRTKQMYNFIKTTFFYQSLFSFIAIGILFISFPYLDRVFFKTHAPPAELYITAFSVLFFIWQNFISNMLFAAKKFFKANLYINIANVLKTLLIFYLAYTRTVSVGTVIFVFGIVGPAIFFTLLFIEKRDFIFVLAKSEIRKEEFRFKFTLTYFFANQFFNLGLRMDLFLLSFYGLHNDVGYYGLAQKIILSIMTTVISITQVLSPNFSKIKSKKDAVHLLKTGFTYLLLPVSLFSILAFTPKWVFELFFTPKFGKTTLIAHQLAIPFIIFSLGDLPLLFILYTFKKPQYVLVSNLLFFLGVTIGCYFLIPIWGVFAAPLVIGVAMLAPVLIQSFAAYHEYKKLPN